MRPDSNDDISGLQFLLRKWIEIHKNVILFLFLVLSQITLDKFISIMDCMMDIMPPVTVLSQFSEQEMWL